MESQIHLIEPLLKRAEQYSKTSFELLKLKSVDKTATIAATLTSRVVLTIALSFFLLTLTIAVALWLGTFFGKNYYGFLVMAALYGFVSIILYVIHSSIKARVGNSIITQLLN